MIWKKLLSRNEDFGNGIVFRCPAEWPYERYVDFMLIVHHDSPSGFALVVSSGLKAGLILVCLPKEAACTEVVGISCTWLKNNWKKWVYEFADEKDIYYSRSYTIDDNWIDDISN